MSKIVLTAQLQLQAPNNVRQVVNQIQNQLNNVNVGVNVQGSAQAQRQLQQITAQTNKATGAAASMGKALGVSIRRFTGLAIATRAVSLLTNSLGAAVRESIAFERELIKISQVTGKTITQLKNLTNTITALSTGLGVSSTSLLKTSRILSQAGLDARQTEVALTALAKTELAPTFDDITQTAEGAVAIFNQFRQGAAALESQLGSLNAVAGKFAVESGDLIATIRRTGGVFKAAGGDLNELIALFTSVRSTTRESAESIATGLRTILTRIQRPKTIEYLRQYGVELETLEGKFVGPFEAIKRLSAATAGLEQGDLQFVEIAEEIAGFRQIGKVIPLLREFRVAQEALKVAQDGTNSLTTDAAKAQAALAVRITKVKEEFLALIRSISETSTFQAMANTVLSIAEAMIKLADAIKPVLPLLGLFAGIKIAKGLGSFVGNIGAGLRGFNKGGVVPGTGNRDTVPAMLTPGEFVIKKSSVAKIGAENLHSMNRYAAGGIVTSDRHAYGRISPSSTPYRNAKNSVSASQWKKMSDTQKQEAAAKQANKLDEKKKSGRAGLITINPSAIGGFFLRPNQGSDRDRTLSRQVQLKDGTYDLKGKIDGFYTGKNDIAGSNIANIVAEETREGLSNSIKTAVARIRSDKLVDIPPAIDGNEKVFESSMANLFKAGGAQDTIEGYMLEGIISAMTNAALAGGGVNFDYPKVSLNATNKQRLGQLFRSEAEIASLVKADAKRTGSDSAFDSIATKLIADLKAGNFEGVNVQRYAKGGAVGTDTVPALLTPGEFVVNKKSAQAIGYSNLKSMNNVGRYAAGGIVSHNRHAYGNAPFTPMGSPGSIPAGPALQQIASSAQAASAGLQQTSKTSERVHMALFAVQSALAYMTPTIDESSGAFERATAFFMNGINSLLAVVQIGVGLLSAFNVELTVANVQMAARNAMQIGGDLLTAGLKGFRGGGGNTLGKTGRNIFRGVRRGAESGGRFLYEAGTKMGGRMGSALQGGGQSLALSGKALGKLAVGLTKFVAVVGVAVTAGTLLSASLNMAAEAIFNFQTRIDTAIKEGDVDKAGAAARGQAQSRNVTGGLGLVAAGALIAGPFGAAVAAAVALTSSFMGNVKQAELQARASAAVVNANKALAKASEDAAMNLKKFEAGDISTTELINRSGIDEAEKSRMEARRNRDAQGEKAGGLESFGRGAARVLTLGLAGLAGLESGAQKNKRIEQSQETFDQSMANSKRAFSQQAGMRSAVFREAAASGKSMSDLDPRLQADPKIAEGNRLLNEAAKLEDAGEIEKAARRREEGQMLLDQGNRLADEFEAIQKAVQRAKEKFDALNLGLNQSAAAIGGASVGMNNLMNSLDSGTPALTSSIATLEASTTSAAGGISAENFQNSLDDAANTLLDYGADPAEVTKMKQNMAAVASAQKELPSAMARFKDSLDGQAASPRDMQNQFKESIQAQLESQGMDKAAIDNIVKSLPDYDELSDEQKGRLESGDMSVFEDQLEEIGGKTMAQFKDQLEQAAAIQKQVIELTKRRIAAENNLINAQKQAIDIQLEAREAEAKFGGKAVSLDERRQSALAKLNTGNQFTGLSDATTDIDSLRQRRKEISEGFKATQLQPGQQQTAENEAQGDRLKQAQQDQVNTIRELIKIQEMEIKQIQEKQRLEKQALDSLLAGDIDKFFEDQATQGAIAAAATGNQSLMGAFGADAMGRGAAELERMREAGVGSVYGQQIGGAGGLQERAALGGLQARGLSGPAAQRAAQIQAGTTQEQLDAEARGRELAGELAATGEMGADMAADELMTAAKMLQEAARIQQQAKDEAQLSADRGDITGKQLVNEKAVADQEKVVEQSRVEAKARREEATAAMAKFNQSKYAGMSNQELLALSDEEYNEARQMKAAAYNDLPMKAAQAESTLATEQAELMKRQNRGTELQTQLENTGTRIGPQASPAADDDSVATNAASAETMMQAAQMNQQAANMMAAASQTEIGVVAQHQLNVNNIGGETSAEMQQQLANIENNMNHSKPTANGNRTRPNVLPTV